MTVRIGGGWWWGRGWVVERVLFALGFGFGFGFFCLGLFTRGCQAATYLFFVSPEKVGKGKTTRLSGSLRFATGDLRCPQPKSNPAN